MIPSFPKIFAIGTNYIRDIFLDPVEITEKIDGSQFAFGKINGDVHIRSKSAKIYTDNPDKMFADGVDYVMSIQDLLPEGMVFYTEYLKKPKHNTLVYGRIPKNHLMLFGVMDITQKFHPMDGYAEQLGIEKVPVFNIGTIKSPSAPCLFLRHPIAPGGPP